MTWNSFFGKPINGYDLLGYSRGSRGAYRFAAAEPDRIRTLGVVASGDLPELTPGLAALPVLICHGQDNQRTPVVDAQRMHDSPRAAGCNCELSPVEGDYFIIAKVLSEGHIFEWQGHAV